MSNKKSLTLKIIHLTSLQLKNAVNYFSVLSSLPFVRLNYNTYLKTKAFWKTKALSRTLAGVRNAHKIFKVYLWGTRSHLYDSYGSVDRFGKELAGRISPGQYFRDRRGSNGARSKRAGQSFTLNLSLRRYLYLHSLLAYIYLETFARKKIYRPPGPRSSRTLPPSRSYPYRSKIFRYRRFAKRGKKRVKKEKGEAGEEKKKNTHTHVGENRTSDWRGSSISQLAPFRKRGKGARGAVATRHQSPLSGSLSRQTSQLNESRDIFLFVRLNWRSFVSRRGTKSQEEQRDSGEARPDV